MKNYGIRTEIESTSTSKYTGYTNVFRYNGQEFPALRDLLGKVVILRNGERGHVLQTTNGICIFCHSAKGRLNAAYGKHLTAYSMNGKGNVKPNFPLKEYDIIQVLDMDNNIFWERKEKVEKPKPFQLTDREAVRLLKQLYGMDVEITSSTKKAGGRYGKKVLDDIKRESALRHESQETITTSETETENVA